MDQPLLRITKIEIKKLFGLYTHTIELKLEDRVTIIHGPNGVGKTVLLRLMKYLFSGRYFELLRVPFESLLVVFSDGAQLTVTQPKSKTLNFVLASPESDQKKFSLDENTLLKLADIRKELPWLTKLDKETWLDRRTEEMLSVSEVLDRYGDLVQEREGPIKLDELKEVLKRISVYLVEAQRLLKIPQPSFISDRPHYRIIEKSFEHTVKAYADELKEKISNTLNEYASKSQSLDQTFPQRLLESEEPSFNIEELKQRMQKLENKRSRLRELDLLGQDEVSSYPPPFNLNALDQLKDTQKATMALYIEDSEKKLEVFDDLEKRLALLMNNINSKFLHKAIAIDRRKGLVARHERNDQVLELDALSSGEQHELVLMYDLLFKVKPNTLVMIDEPELSLHVTWQDKFLSDLLEIVKVTQFDVLLATHSPYIIGDRDDLMVSLSSEIDEH